MPPIQEHINLSIKRTGRSFREVHEWMDGKNMNLEEKEARHNILKIPEFLPTVEKNFGKEGVREYLQHIKDDHEQTKIHKLVRMINKARFWKK